MKKLIALLLVALVLFSFAACGSSSSYSSSKSSSTKRSCYVCGKSASKKYGSHYYCSTHYAMVKTVVEAG